MSAEPPTSAPAPGRPRFPFTAVVGQDDLKLALLLAAVDPGIGGVLLRGDKGSGKTTLARGLAALLPGAAPFVELPLGASEDRVLGSIDLAAALTEGATRARRGLLADADGGVLYVDEVNLLADHLVDALLDVAVSGEHRLERDGVSVVHPARFVLVGTMNPEEGELRPQLLDRFGLCVTVRSPEDPAERAEIVRRRLAFDGGGAGRAEADGPADAELRDRLAATAPATVGDDVIDLATRLALAVGAEGVRADIVLCRAAAALAGWEDRDRATPDDVERVAPLVLAHRRRRSPFDPPTLPPEDLADALDQARDEQPGRGEGRADEAAEPPPPAGDGGDPDAGGNGNGDGGAPPPRPVTWGDERRAPVMPAGGAAPTAASGAPPAARRRPGAPARATPSARGRELRDEPFTEGGGRRVAVAASARAFARRRADDPSAVAGPDDLRASVREERPGTLVVIALDTSGSMGARERVAAATGAVLGLLTDAYQRRDRVAVVTFDGTGARVALAPTSSVEVARSRLAGLSTGGTTPLADGLRTALDVATRRDTHGGRSVLVAVTDGRATGDRATGEPNRPGEPTGPGDALANALAAAEAVRAAGVPALVLDAETGTPRLGLATRLAAAMGAACRPVSELTAGTLNALARP